MATLSTFSLSPGSPGGSEEEMRAAVLREKPQEHHLVKPESTRSWCCCLVIQTIASLEFDRYFSEPQPGESLNPTHNLGFVPLKTVGASYIDRLCCLWFKRTASTNITHFHMALAKVMQFAPSASKETLIDLTAKVERCITHLSLFARELESIDDPIHKTGRSHILSMIEQDQGVLNYLSTYIATHYPPLPPAQ